MTTRLRPFSQVDVFTATPYLGNPLAVVLDGSGLTDQAMQRFAQWTHLSETTFILPPTQTGAHYRLRIFTPGGELPFAGHPTLGSCHAWLEQQSRQAPKLESDPGFVPGLSDAQMIVQECAVGLVRIRRAGHQLAFAAPALVRSAPEASLLTRVLQALGVHPEQVKASQLLCNGPTFLGLLLDSPETVLNMQPDHQALRAINQKVGVAAAYETVDQPLLVARSSREARAFDRHGADSPQLAQADLEVRAFVAPAGVDEDPVTGSLNASLAQWLMTDGLMPERYVAAQGACLGRAGRVYLERDAAGQVWVAGQCVTCIEGRVQL